MLDYEDIRFVYALLQFRSRCASNFPLIKSEDMKHLPRQSMLSRMRTKTSLIDLNRLKVVLFYYLWGDPCLAFVMPRPYRRIFEWITYTVQRAPFISYCINSPEYFGHFGERRYDAQLRLPHLRYTFFGGWHGSTSICKRLFWHAWRFLKRTAAYGNIARRMQAPLRNLESEFKSLPHL